MGVAGTAVYTFVTFAAAAHATFHVFRYLKLTGCADETLWRSAFHHAIDSCVEFVQGISPSIIIVEHSREASTVPVNTENS